MEEVPHIPLTALICRATYHKTVNAEESDVVKEWGLLLSYDNDCVVMEVEEPQADGQTELVSEVKAHVTTDWSGALTFHLPYIRHKGGACISTTVPASVLDVEKGTVLCLLQQEITQRGRALISDFPTFRPHEAWGRLNYRDNLCYVSLSPPHPLLALYKEAHPEKEVEIYGGKEAVITSSDANHYGGMARLALMAELPCSHITNGLTLELHVADDDRQRFKEADVHISVLLGITYIDMDRLYAIVSGQ
jgi:hypothetical protein